MTTHTNTSEWHNTGNNGSALAEWVRKVGSRTAIARVMPYRVMLEKWVGSHRDVSIAEPFATLSEAKAYADKFLSA